jgi:hypothetical protein
MSWKPGVCVYADRGYSVFEFVVRGEAQLECPRAYTIIGPGAATPRLFESESEAIRALRAVLPPISTVR